MVFIRDGEILQDEDPRASAPSASSPQQPPVRGAAHPSAPQGAGPAFDLSAPPVRLQQEPPEQSLFGLPGIAIFGAHFRSRHLAMLLGATVFLGWRGFLLGAGIWVIYKLNSGTNAPAAQSGSGSGQAQTGADMAQRIQNMFSGASTNRAYDSSQSPWAQQQQRQQRPGQVAGQAGPPAGTPVASWQGKGQGQKLGSS